MEFNDVITQDIAIQTFKNEYTRSLLKDITKKINNEYFDKQSHEGSLNFANFTRCDFEYDKIVMQSYKLTPVYIYAYRDDMIVMYIRDTTLYSAINDNIYSFVKMCAKECEKHGKKFYLESRYIKLPANKYWIFEKKFCDIIPHLIVLTVNLDTRKLMFETPETYTKFKKMCKENIHINEIKLGNQLTSLFAIAQYIPVCDKDIINGKITVK